MSQPEPTVTDRIKTAISHISICDDAADVLWKPTMTETINKAIKELEAALKQIQFARAEAQAQIDRF